MFNICGDSSGVSVVPSIYHLSSHFSSASPHKRKSPTTLSTTKNKPKLAVSSHVVIQKKEERNCKLCQIN